MQNVPKIVVKRLQVPPAESHPDADLLTAFAEQSLTGAERDHVVEHLARCGDCREVVSLALPAQVELQPSIDSSPNWFGWTLLRGSALRWSTVAAGVVLIASIGMVQYRRQQPRELALNLSQAKQEIATPPQPASQMAISQTRIADEKVATPQSQTGNRATPSEGANFRPRANAIHGAGDGTNSSAGRSFAAGSFHGSAIAESFARPAPAAVGQNPTPAPAPQTVEVTAESTPQSQTQDQFVQSETAEQSADRVAKAKTASAQASTVMAPPSLHSEPMLMKTVAGPRWTIGASGALQRSFDGGQTWVEVNVATNDSTASNFMHRARKETAVEVSTEAQTAPTSEAQPEAAPTALSAASVNAPSGNATSMKKQSTPGAPVTFRALSVSSNAAEVWAGGSGGALYHTSDAGNHWARVVPSASGTILTGDILSIQFSDPRIGTVTTSTPEIWTTLDAGQTWHKQP